MYNNIEAERVRANLTKQELAAELHVTTSTYTGYVVGRRPIPSDVLLALSSRFNCSVDYLLGRKAPEV